MGLSYYTLSPILRTLHLPSKMPLSEWTPVELLILIIIAGSPIIIVVVASQSFKRKLINMSESSLHAGHDPDRFSTRLTLIDIIDNIHTVSHSVALVALGFASPNAGDGRDGAEGIKAQPFNNFDVATTSFATEYASLLPVDLHSRHSDSNVKW